MKMLKLASSTEIPDGYVGLEVIIGEDGSVSAKWIRDGKSKCDETSGKALNDLLNTSVAGFSGGLMEESSGPMMTQEGAEQIGAAIVPTPSTPSNTNKVNPAILPKTPGVKVR